MSNDEVQDALQATIVIEDVFPGVTLKWNEDGGCPTEIVIPAEFPKSNYDVANGVATILEYFGWSVKLDADDL
jgi:hypothetical protein